jgi:hypothetical protein
MEFTTNALTFDDLMQGFVAAVALGRTIILAA